MTITGSTWLDTGLALIVFGVAAWLLGKALNLIGDLIDRLIDGTFDWGRRK